MKDAPAPDASEVVINCSIVLKELPLTQRLRAADEAGYRSFELWWPFATAHPDNSDVDDFVAEVEESGLRLVGLNLFAGNMAGGERGILSSPDRRDELMSSARVALHVADRLGVRHFNVLYGNRLDGFLPETQDAVAEANLRDLAPMFADVRGTLMIEAVSGAPAYPIRTADDAAAVIRRAQSNGGPRNLGLLLDLYHLAVNGDDVAAAVSTYGEHAAHVQIADAPGRGAPGTGTLPLAEWVSGLRRAGYDGRFALEYTHLAGDALAHASSWKELE